MSSSLSHRYTEIDQWIIEGKLIQAKRALKELFDQKVKDEVEAISLASLCKRVEWNDRALKVLAPFVVGRGRLLPRAGVAAKLEYADVLRNLGLLSECRKILAMPDVSSSSRAPFILGLSYLHDYQLERAEETLLKIVRQPGEGFSHYQRQVVGVNLLMAMLHDVSRNDRMRLFSEWYSRVEKECKKTGYVLLLKHLQVIGLQFQILTGKEISQGAIEVEELPEFSRMTAQLYLLLGGFKGKRISRALFLKEMEKLRSECERLRLFEVCREADFHSGRVLEDRLLLQKVLDRTFFQAYRQKIRQSSSSMELQEERSFGNASGFALELNLRVLQKEPLLAKCLLLLMQEQYLPLSVHFLWNHLFPERHFIEPSSRQSIHQLIRRMRHFFREQDMPLEIVVDGTGYRIRFTGQKSVRMVWPSEWSQSSERASPNLNLAEFVHQLREKVKSPIRFHQVQELFPEKSRRTLQFFLMQAVEGGVLFKTGKNKGCYYEWSAG